MKSGDTVKIVKYVDEEADVPRTDLVGKLGVVSQVWEDYTTVYVNGELIAFYPGEIAPV